MLNREIAIIVTIDAILISIPVTYFPIVQVQGAPAKLSPDFPSTDYSKIVNYHKARAAGLNMTWSNMTTGSNMTGAAGNTTGNTTGAAHGSSIPTTHPAGSNSSNLDRFKQAIGKGLGSIFSGK
jgi:hypothetical protein